MGNFASKLQTFRLTFILGFLSIFRIFNIIATFYTAFNKGDLYKSLVKRNSKFDEP